MLDPIRLRLLREFAEHGTMTAVGEVCRMTSSAVSQQLATLEREAKVPLFERTGRRVRLTTEGWRLVRHAHIVLNALDAAEADLHSASTPRGPVRVATFGTAALQRLLPAIAAARTRHPQLNVILHELEPHEAIDVLRAGDCDLAITFTYNLIPEDPPPGVSRHLLGVESILIALPADHPAATGDVDLRLLREEPWMAGSQGTTDHEMLDRACALAGFHPNVIHTADDYALVLRMVREGLGAALVPEVVATLGVPDGVVLRSITAIEITRTTHALTRTPTPATNALLELLVSVQTVRP
ncbi:DNA-binding transcriptional LysR family regulator [Kribbella sp. VKM Ac-2527]|uniref:DNA-binding transcriptional LysR family regulator n=1 Tax=Kribbella caucasensis TaxID=2512215 RepID=A0A4R6K2G0_9ACTN|nr:LysR family transcriptional regulator [Kribbella sp. VKM Ac-2527]TDO43404.1 DNA-binding transcriptional LysR family regulator [Kribbella sp. VKM Ac-2527]